MLQPVVREKLFSVPSAGGHIVILLIVVGLLQFSLEIKCLCAPCPPLQEFRVRDDRKSCAEKPVGVWTGFVRMTIGDQHLSTLASWAFYHHTLWVSIKNDHVAVK